METLKLRIPYEDRIGLVLEVSKVLYKFGLNIVALQLMNNVMYLEIEKHSPETWLPLKIELEAVVGILFVETVADMPYQSRENQMEAIINSMTPKVKKTDGFKEIIGNSICIKDVINLARQVAKSDSSVMLKGESGTGKELFARAIHLASDRQKKVFVPLNCGALPENLLESELFGYTNGAFSGAKKGGRVGLFQFANEGTIFLDEISELPLHLQVKLLRVLQEGKVRPLGSNQELPIYCRVIAATNRNIEEMVRDGLFREDLYYRLNVIPINIPPLRQRKEDIALLAKGYLDKYSKRTGRKKYLSTDALEKLMTYNWPGNVRELENILERALHISRGQEILRQHIMLEVDLKNVHYKINEIERENLKEAAERAEKEVIIKALKTYGSIRKAAVALGVSHTTLANKINKMGLNTGKKT